VGDLTRKTKRRKTRSKDEEEGEGTERRPRSLGEIEKCGTRDAINLAAVVRLAHRGPFSHVSRALLRGPWPTSEYLGRSTLRRAHRCTGCDISPLPCRVLSPGPSLAPSAPPPCNPPRVHFYTPSLDPIFLLFAEPSPPSNSSPFPLCHSRSSNPYCFYQRALLDLCVYMSRLVKQTERRTATCNAYPRDKVLGLATRRGYDIIAWDK